MEKIDLVVPYVDSSDSNWQELFNKYNPIKDKEIEGINAKNRFRGQGDFFRFFFRGVDKYMPWIGTIHLLVQSESQVPAWINRDTVHVVLHDQFIPNEFLPTFNSTTIEMFLWNIPGLSEKFIYANDDMFVTNAISKYHMFRDFNVVTSVFSVTRLSESIYYKQVDNSYKEIYKHLQDEVITVGHTFKPLFKSDVYDCFVLHKDHILNSISQFREPKNFNVYLFTYDLKRKNKLINESAIELLTSSKIKSIISALYNSDKMIICIQDTDSEINPYDSPDLLEAFKMKFPIKSKYERPDVYSITDEQLEKIEELVSKVPDNLKESFRQTLLKSWSL